MISEGSCDWSNNAKDLALKSQPGITLNYILKYIQIEKLF